MRRLDRQIMSIKGVAYIAYPFGEKGKIFIDRIKKRYPCLILLDPIKILSVKYRDGNWYKIHKYDCLELLSKSDYLILAGKWDTSADCMAAWGFAVGTKMKIFTLCGKTLY